MKKTTNILRTTTQKKDVRELRFFVGGPYHGEQNGFPPRLKETAVFTARGMKGSYVANGYQRLLVGGKYKDVRIMTWNEA